MEISRKLYDRLEEEGLRVSDNYSGRFMFGETCFGVVVDNIATAVYDLSESLREIIITESRNNQDLAKEAADVLEDGKLTECRTDSMGLDYIIYFPDITVEQEEV